MKYAAITILSCVLVYMPASRAQDFVDFDARVLAMGGAGVAWAPPDEASFLNPALIAASSQMSAPPDFARVYGGVHFIDREHLREGLRAYHDLDPQSALSRAIAAVDAKLDAHQLPTQAQLDALHAAAQQFAAGLRALPNYSLELQADAGLAAGRSENGQGIGVFVRQQYLGGALLSITEHDKLLLDVTLAQAQQFIRQVEAGVPLSSLTPPADPKDQLNSSFTLSGAIITEQGMTWGVRPEDLGGATALGISLKSVRVQGVGFDATVENARRSQFNLADNSRTWSVPEADVGFTTGNHRWRFGVVANNLFAHDFVLPNGLTLPFSTTVRGGLAYHRTRWTLAADLDLTANQPYGFAARRRDLALGEQYVVGEGFDLRAGWHRNLVNGEQAPSVGFGWDQRDLQVDFAVSQYRDDYAAAMSIGARF